MVRKVAAIAVLATLGGPALTLAQTSTSPAAPFVIQPGTTHSRQDRTIAKQSANQTLSGQLSRTNGTLHPPPVDPGMQKKPTVGGTMPVVPPPGTPGGNPRVIPK